MAIIQIPNLPGVTGLSGAELFEGVQAGTSVKITLYQIIAAARGSVPLSFPIPASQGGTGFSSYTVGDILYASATDTLSQLADVATGNAIISGGVGAAPSYGKIGLTTHVSGVLPVANGGTNQSAALTQYGMIYGNTTTSMASTAAGTATQVLHGNAAGAPFFGAVSLTADVSGTLPVANGGTGVTTSTGTGSVVLSASPALTGNPTITSNSASAALTVTQTGAGAAFLVEDSASPDASPFIIDTSGNVGIGTATPLVQLHSVSGGSSGISPVTSAIRQFFESSGPAGIQVAAGGTTNPSYLMLGSNGSAQATRLSSQIGFTQLSASGASDYMTFQTGGFVDRMIITSAGNVVVGYGDASATPIGNILRGPNSSGTDISGASLTVQGGRGTGTGAGGAIIFSTAAAGTAGSTLNAAVERLRVESAGQIGIGGANYGSTGQTIVSAGSGAAPAWGTLPVAGGGTGAITLTGYVKGTGTAALTASATIPNTDISGLGTMSTQAASAVAITGGTINGTTVGATTASTGAFTSLTSTSGGINGTVGATTPSSGAFTTVTASTSVLSTGAGGIGYATGAGVAVTQLTSRTTTTPTTGAKTTGAVTLFTTTAVVGTYFSFTVPNTAIAITDTVVVTVRGATNTYVAFVSAIVAATSFNITMSSVSGVASDTPIVNFTIIKGVSA